ncbi:hypothetical protein [Phycisphaera mikurensis]|uniref:Uncharacterized protein n=1 Tax=Phycisphaera mikurensis (strain NBRC 102666 / KCTC 22515 / FYK2301M01) TaxID=1142394 RepID=I0IAF9_PHYMF|nr:hypothetical protein [Phycisphaera mikurensis]MBB6441756.1 hypothetical protein [Phycisphaera mikurensis]BAM02247.1 hypothetical protein PSMK_00880 [Phycisphaera mikurensis NBRC 102666]
MLKLLPEPLSEPLAPVFDALPLGRALRELVVRAPLGGAPHAAVAAAVGDPAVADRPELAAALWLYVDDLDRAHDLVQALHTPTGSLLHAILHRREGDFPNALYWYRKAGHHPAFARIDLTGGGAGSGTAVARYEAGRFVEQVQHAVETKNPENPALVSQQNKEWVALFGWLIENPSPTE